MITETPKIWQVNLLSDICVSIHCSKAGKDVRNIVGGIVITTIKFLFYLTLIVDFATLVSVCVVYTIGAVWVISNKLQSIFLVYILKSNIEWKIIRLEKSVVGTLSVCVVVFAGKAFQSFPYRTFDSHCDLLEYRSSTLSTVHRTTRGRLTPVQ